MSRVGAVLQPALRGQRMSWSREEGPALGSTSRTSWRLCRHLTAPDQASFDSSHSALQSLCNCCVKGVSQSTVSCGEQMLQAVFQLW